LKQLKHVHAAPPEKQHITFDEDGNIQTAPSTSEHIQTQSLASQKYENLLSSRLKRKAVVQDALNELQTQKNMWGKGKKYKLKEDDLGNPIWKWRNERKK